MRDHPRVRARLASLTESDHVSTSPICLGEIAYGIARLADGRRRQELTQREAVLHSAIACEPITRPMANRYGEIKRQQEGLGTPLDENDLWIAASAAVAGAVIVTRDGDFSRIRGLVVEDWSL